MHRHLLLIVVALAFHAPQLLRAETPDGFVSLFDGKTFAGWEVPEGDNGHWKIAKGVIDYDASSEAPDDTRRARRNRQEERRTNPPY